MAGVFISYRRNDSDVAAGRLADDLSEIFGRSAIFRDVDTLEVGEDYVKALDHALDSCVALIAIIGPHWSKISNEVGQRRLQDPHDWVRLEIRRALDRGVRVIPVLVAAAMPPDTDVPEDLKPLLQRQALELTDRHWKQDIDLLAQALEKIPGFATRTSIHNRTGTRVTRRYALAAAVSMLCFAIVAKFRWQIWNRVFRIPSADLSQWVRIRDSGTEGTSASQAMVTAMEVSLAKKDQPIRLSARYLYEKAKIVDRFGPKVEGTDLTTVLSVAETFGVPPESLWPYIPGSRTLPEGVSWKELDHAATQFRARTFPLSRFQEIPRQLSQGRPVLAEIHITNTWLSEETRETGIIALNAQESLKGRHAIVIVGYDPDASTIRFANSWGVGWGADGFGTISTKDVPEIIRSMWAVGVSSRKQ